MKVNLYITEDISDQERRAISEALGVKLATRDQLKEFMWSNGKNWRMKLGVEAPHVARQIADDELAALL